jgi:glycosyltransferase involved in cell wall biosynthesis
MSFWSQITVVMIALDAEEVIGEALASIPPEAERLVADGGSQDDTIMLAQGAGARVIDQDHDAVAGADGNFDVARNSAAGQARRDWIFFLDADERISPALADEIAALPHDIEAVALSMPRTNLFWGKPVRLLGEDRQVRLLRKGAGNYRGQRLHRQPEIDGRLLPLQSPLVHQNWRRWSDIRLRFRRYLPLEARHCDGPGGRLRGSRRALTMFRYFYCRQQAFRDGWRGLVVSLVYAAYHGAIVWKARHNNHA